MGWWQLEASVENLGSNFNFPPTNSQTDTVDYIPLINKMHHRGANVADANTLKQCP